jgi:HD-GYP domain-containing protein (c-di-GMP phosphodiesterase class II)
MPVNVMSSPALVPVEELRVGMYVHALNGSWMDHDFWRERFPIDGPAVLERLRRSGVRSVWVDFERSAPGVRPAPASDTVPATPPGQVAAGPDAASPGEACAPTVAAMPEPPARTAHQPKARRGVAAAARSIAEARSAVSAIFREARSSGRIDRQLVRDTARSLRTAVEHDPDTMLALLRLKQADEYTSMHSLAVGALLMRLTRTMGMDTQTQDRAVTAGLLHDIGKIAVPRAILDKPGSLDDAEWLIVRRHPIAGHALLLGSGQVDEMALDVCRHHHERVDGDGYPDRLSGAELSTFARMGAVCDVYDAITSDRPYKKGWTPAEALRRMAATRTGHFDELVFRAFVKTIGPFPVGALVRLASQRLALVVASNPGSLRTPTVRVFYSIQLQERVEPRTIDLADGRDSIVDAEDPRAWDLTGLESLLD